MTYSEQTQVKAALFDIDGTLTTGGTVWKPLVKSPQVTGWRKAWLYGTVFPHYGLTKTRLISQAGFRDRWVRVMAWLMTGWSAVQAGEICDQIVQQKLVPVLRPDVVELLKQHKALSRPVLLVSTMFSGIVSRLAEYLGADAGLGSEVGFNGDTCTGRIIGQTCSGGRKIEFTRRALAARWPEISLADCVAYADSASDIPFLAGAGFAVAVHPDASMYAAAQARGWLVVGRDG